MSRSGPLIPPAVWQAALLLSLGANAYLLIRPSGQDGTPAPATNLHPAPRGGGASRVLPSGEISGNWSWSDITRDKSRKLAWENRVAADPPAALAGIMTTSEGTDREEMVAAVLRIWAKTHPEKAAAWLESPDGQTIHLDAVAQDLAEVWAGISGPDAAHWIDSLKSPSLQTTLAEVVAGIWAAQDGQAAVRWIESSWKDGEAGVALHLALDAWAENSPDGLRSSLNSFGDDLTRNEAAKALGAKIAETDGDDAWNFALGQPRQDTRTEAALAVMETWADTAPSKAARAIQATDNTDIRTHATRALAAKWIVSDRGLALDWLQTLPPGPQADAGYEAASQQLSSIAPREAFGLALKISDPTLRRETADSAFADLLATDPDPSREAALLEKLLEPSE